MRLPGLRLRSATRKTKMDEGTFVGAVVPVGLKPEVPEPAKVKVEGKKEAKVFLAMVDEAPEGEKMPEVLLKLKALKKPEAPDDEEDIFGDGALEPAKAPEPVAPEPVAPEPVAPVPPEPVAPVPPEELAASKAEEVKLMVADGPVRLDAEAYGELEEKFIALATPEDLRPEDKARFEHVKMNGVGICARCRWQSGCLACDEEKAWSFACRSTLWAVAGEGVRPKAKPKGRPSEK